MGEDFLARLIKPDRPPTQPYAGPTRDATKYAAAALAGEVANVQAVPIGAGRNHQLNVSAMKLGQLVASGQLAEHDVIEALGAADGGLDYPATRTTIMSGLEAGKQQRRTIPDLQKAAPWEQADDPLAPGYTPSAPSGAPAVNATPTTLKSSDASPADPNADTTAASRDSYVHEKLPIVDWQKLWLDDSKEDWIVEPLLPARRLIALYSAPKVGKSILLLELAAAVSRGAKVLGVTPTRAYRVLYVDFENDPKTDIRVRLQSMGLDWTDLDNLCYLSFPSLAGFDTERGSQELLAAIQTYECEVVVIDTVSRSVDGDENENDTWLNFYRHTGLKLKQAGVAMIRLDHTGKDETKGQRGGSAKSGDVDAIWKLARLTDGADGSPETFRLSCDDTRFPILPADKLLTLERLDGPLRHIIRPSGAKDTIVGAIVNYLDSFDAPITDGRDKYNLADFKNNGIPGASQRTLTEALKIRRKRDADPFDT